MPGAHSTPCRAGSFFTDCPALPWETEGTLPLRPWQQSLWGFRPSSCDTTRRLSQIRSYDSFLFKTCVSPGTPSCRRLWAWWWRARGTHLGLNLVLATCESISCSFTEVVPASSFPPLSSCPGTCRRLDLLFTFAHAVSPPSVVPPSPLPTWTSFQTQV